MLRSLQPPPVPATSSFLFDGDLVKADAARKDDIPSEVAIQHVTGTDALSKIERLCGCSILNLLRIDGDSIQSDNLLLHNSQLRVALTELLTVHHQCANQVRAEPYLSSLSDNIRKLRCFVSRAEVDSCRSLSCCVKQPYPNSKTREQPGTWIA